MNGQRRACFWIEVAFAALSACLFVATVVTPNWIEVVFGVDPDRGNGALEVLISAVSLTATISFGVLARLEHRRAQTAPN
jgi:hypothetical protein